MRSRVRWLLVVGCVIGLSGCSTITGVDVSKCPWVQVGEYPVTMPDGSVRLMPYEERRCD